MGSGLAEFFAFLKDLGIASSKVNLHISILMQGDAKRFFNFLLSLRGGQGTADSVSETELAQVFKYPVHTAPLLPKACSAVVLCLQLFRAITRDQGHLVSSVQVLAF